LFDDPPASVRAVLALSLDDIYVSTDEDIRHSTDEGETWVSFGTAARGAESLAVDRYGTLHAGALRTRNAGEFWFERQSEPQSLPGLIALPDHSLMASTVRSTDYGDTWTELTDVSPLRSVSALRDGSHVGLAEYGMFYSADYGVTWQPITSPEADSWTDLVQLEGGSLLATWRTAGDSGELWVSTPFESMPPAVVEPGEERPDTCYDGEVDGDEERLDCGGSCGVCEDWSVRECLLEGLFGTSDGTLFSIDAVGDELMRSIDGGATWELSDPTLSLPIAEVAGSIYVYVRTTTGGSLVVSTDQGESFSRVSDSVLPE
jgi:hypothetical protein